MDISSIEETRLLNEATKKLEAQNSALEHELQSAINKLNVVEQSFSWRITRPLRWVGKKWMTLKLLRAGLPVVVRNSGGFVQFVRLQKDAIAHTGFPGARVAFIRQILAAADYAASQTHERPNQGGLVDKIVSSHKPGIVFVSHEATRTGAPVFLLNLIRLLQSKLDISVYIVLREGGELLGQFQELGETFLLGGGPIPRSLVNKLKHQNIKLVYSNTITNGRVQDSLSALGVPIYCHVHELEHSIEHFFGGQNLRLVKSNTDIFLAGSGAVRSSLISKFDIPPEKIRLAYPFVNVESNIKTVSATNLPLKLPEGAFVVGGCGTINWRKGPDLFIQLARQVINKAEVPVHFVWVGGPTHGADFENLMHDVRSSGISSYVHFVGPVDDHLRYFAQFDAFALTSREDPFPLVALDAASLGIPVCCFQGAGGTPELVAHIGESYSVPYLDTNAMAVVLLKLVRDQAEYQAASAAIQKAALKCFDEGAAGAKIADLVSECLFGGMK